MLDRVNLIAASDLPSSLAPGQLESESRGFLWFEDQTVLTSSLQVQTAGADPTSTIAAGTQVCVYFFHLDISRDVSNTSEIDFGLPILGFATSQASLNATSRFEVSGVDYAIDVEAPLEENDEIAIDGDMVLLRTLTGLGGRDHVRFFVDCG